MDKYNKFIGALGEKNAKKLKDKEDEKKRKEQERKYHEDVAKREEEQLNKKAAVQFEKDKIFLRNFSNVTKTFIKSRKNKRNKDARICKRGIRLMINWMRYKAMNVALPIEHYRLFQYLRAL